MIKATLSILLVLNLQATMIAQQIYLEPVEDTFDARNMFMSTEITHQLSQDAIVRFYYSNHVSSYMPEKLIAIEKEQDQYYIVYHSSRFVNSLFGKANTMATKKNQKKVTLSTSDALLYIELFALAIKNKKKISTNGTKRDGINYYFSISDQGSKTAYIWSPDKKSAMGRLQKIGISLIQLANDTDEGKTVRLPATLIKRIQRLTKELKELYV